MCLYYNNITINACRSISRYLLFSYIWFTIYVYCVHINNDLIIYSKLTHPNSTADLLGVRWTKEEEMDLILIYL